MVMMRKMLLLVAMALAAVALAAPAIASAEVWTDNDAPLEEEETASQAFEGTLTFTSGMIGSYSCQVTVEIVAEGPSNSSVPKFNPTTSSCSGTGAFAGCELKEHFTIPPPETIPTTWEFTFTPPRFLHTKAKLRFRYLFKGCFISESQLEFESLAATPTLNAGGTITSLALSGTATNGTTVASGSIAPEGSLTLGIE